MNRYAKTLKISLALEKVPMPVADERDDGKVLKQTGMERRSCAISKLKHDLR